MKILFGTRGSALALAQTEQIMVSFSALHPQIEVEKRIIKTSGDRDQASSLSQLGGWGAFTRELEKALLAKEIDVAVHSLKDLPTVQPDPLKLVAVAAREDAEDVLLSNEGYTIQTLPSGAVVGTSSLRREVQLRRFRPDIRIKDIRGNVQTRIDKLRRGDYDAILLARAGLSRLGLMEEEGLHIIPATLMVPAPGQGAIAVEIRKEDQTLEELLSPLNDLPTEKAVFFERLALKAFGGGCRSPLAIHATAAQCGLAYRAFASDDANRYFYVREGGCALETVEESGETLGKILKEAASAAGDGAAEGGTLKGCRILVTRPKHQSKDFTETLKAQGAEVLEQPLITIHGVAGEIQPETVDKGWLLFTSVNTVHYFLNPERKEAQPVTLKEGVRIAAIGEATAAALALYGLVPELIPTKATAKVLANELLACDPHAAGTPIVIPRGDKALPELCELLEGGGMKPLSPLCYETRTVTLSAEEKEAVLSFQPQVICAFSPSAVTSMKENGLGQRTVEEDEEILFASIGPTTTEALLAQGFSPVLESAVQRGQHLCDVIRHFL